MNLSDVRRLYAYNDWANDRMLAVIAVLSDEQFTRRIVSSYSSIRDTLAHIAFGEWLWLQRWMGESPSKFPDWTNAPSLAILEGRMHETAADRRAYLADLRDEAIGSTLEYTSTDGDRFTMPLSSVLIHCANHSTYHRGQLATMLRQAGAAPPNTDYMQFARS